MRKCLLMPFICIVLGSMMKADPVVSGVSWKQDTATRKITVTYNLSETAIVTMDVCTNGNVSIGGEHVVSLAGDVNREVVAGNGHSIIWVADKDWPGHNTAAGDLSISVRAWTKSVPPDYLVVDLRMTNTTTCSTLRYYQDAASIPGGVTNGMYKTKMLVMRRIPAAGATWRMGSPTTETGRSGGTVEPEHYVSFDADYYIGVYPVTVGQYRHISGNVPGRSMDGFDMSIVTNADCHPVGGVSYSYVSSDSGQGYLMRSEFWPDNKDWDINYFKFDGFIRRLYWISGIKFNLPTEAQWEYACRAGSSAAYNSGKDCTTTGEDTVCPNMDEVGWYKANTSTTQPVGLKRANAWGIYDLHGNVWEWCLDWYGTISETTSSDPVLNPSGAPAASDSNKKRVRRGGGYSSGAKYCRSASRGNANATANYANHGFRIACPIPANW